MSLSPPPSRDPVPVEKDQAGKMWAKFPVAWQKWFSAIYSNMVSTVTDTSTISLTIGGQNLTADTIPIAQTNYTASRALNTTYAASATRSVLVMASVKCITTLAGGNSYVQGKSDSASPPTTVASGLVGIEAGLLNENNTFQLSFIVAPGMNYRLNSTVTNGSANLEYWFEALL